MTIAQLKRSMDTRFRAVDRRFATIDRRFAAIDRRFAAIDRRFAAIDRRFETVDLRFEAIESQIRTEAEATRRHFDVVVESLRDDFRLFADAIAHHSGQLAQHDSRLSRLERGSV